MCRPDETIVTYQSNVEVSPGPTCRTIQSSVGNSSKLHEVFQQIKHTGHIHEDARTAVW